ncbi:MAG: hypothetical protein IPM57_06090 [Oligoflexia bacterium]|nr:hypothetical protein [Oligoflexia bacterium]
MNIEHLNRSKNLLTADWFSNHPEKKYSKNFLPHTADSSSLKEILWPIAMDYDNPLNAVFLLQIPHLEMLNQKSVWLIRDGLVPLMWFFNKNPNPKNVKSKLLVEQSFADFIPNKWRDRFGTYKIVTKNMKPYKNICVSALLLEAYCSLDYFVNSLKESTNILDKNYFKMPKTSFFVHRFGYSNPANEQIYSSRFMLELFKHFGLNFNPINWNQLSEQSEYNETLYFDFNEKLLIADSFITHLILSRGGQILNDKNELSGKYIPFSIFHGVLVEENLKKTNIKQLSNKDKNQYELLNKRLVSAMTSEANKKFPWPNWFAEWTMASTKQGL